MATKKKATVKATPIRFRTPQNIFTVVSNHLLRQYEPSMNADMCMYRGPDKTKCAIGVLIPDELYQKKWEGTGIGDGEDLPDGSGRLYQKDIAKAARIKPQDYEFAKQLQSLHDLYEPNLWLAGLKKIGREFKLDISHLKNHKKTGKK